MRSRICGAVAVTVLLAASGCGGDYSNADVEFAAAIPRRSDVTVRMPLQSGLQASGLREEGVTSFAVGDPSQAAADARSTANGLDGMVGFFIQLLEATLRVDPTTRTPELRIWGPFPNQDAPDWELQLLITRQPVKLDPAEPGDPVEGFGWAIRYKRRSAQEWLEPALLQGFYEPGEIRHGRGLVVFHAAEFRASGMATAQNLSDLGQLAGAVLGYDTRTGQPHTIRVVAADDAGQQVAIDYQELDTSSGQLVFDLRSNDFRARHVQAAARWTPDYQGRSDMAVLEGLATGQRAVECWDAQQRVVFVSNPWEGDLGGDEARCAFGAP
jgi:hypothetical protein